MTLEKIKNSAKLFIEGQLSAEEFSPIFNEFYKMYFDYQKVKEQDLELADLVEKINEDVSRYEANQETRLLQPDYYINDLQLKDSVRRLVK